MTTNVILNWTARISGALATLFYAYWVYKSGETLWSTSFLVVLGFGFAGYVFAWFREKEGGIVMVIAGMLLGMYMFYSGGLNPVALFLTYSIPFLIPGFVFWWLGGKNSESNNNDLTET
ncbi:MAG: hypothetical protein R2764_23720 [Bacteroidales bacterium]